jgi:ERAP1-like C-terminal domain
MTPEGRLNFVADSWALVQAGRAEASSYLALVEQLGRDDHRAVWDLVITSMTRLDRLARERPERPRLRNYARARLRPVFDRLGWDAKSSEKGADDDEALLRSSLIRSHCAIPSPSWSGYQPIAPATTRCWRWPAGAR